MEALHNNIAVMKNNLGLGFGMDGRRGEEGEATHHMTVTIERRRGVKTVNSMI